MSSNSHSPYRDLDDNAYLPSSHQNLSRTGTPSNIRPRIRRGVPGSTELIASADLGLGLGSTSARAASPIPPKHPSRQAGVAGAAGRNGIQGSGNGKPVGGLVDPVGGRATGSPTMGFGRGLWGGVWTGSWSAVQGLASSYLGGEVGDEAASEDINPIRAGKAAGLVEKKKAPATWGPSGLRNRGEGIAAGSSMNQSAVLTARKTASVLESHEGVNGGLDVNGNYKRRSSSEVPTSPGIEEEALCYIHIVQPTDTQAGVVLRYQCQDTAMFRRANRLIPSDPIQLRKTVFLPVETCTIKGRPCDGPSDTTSVDLLALTPSYENGPSSSNYTNGTPWDSSSQQQENPFASPAPPRKEGGEEPWTHVRWVLLFSSPSSKPTEIVRLPRKTLGFFPPRRRKSLSRLSSTLSTPRSSIDLLPSDSPFGTPSRLPNALNPSNSIGSYFPSSASNPSSASRPRADSASSTASASRTGSTPNSVARIPAYMRRPGGVGTMAWNVRAPGPAQDGFNAWATRQFPTLTIDHLPSSSGGSGTRVDNLGFGFADELASINEIPTPGNVGVVDTGAGSGLGIGFGIGNIEGWVRKTISRAPGTPKLNPKTVGRGLGGGIGGVGLIDGDLIELLDGAGSDDGRSFEPNPVPTSTTGTSRTGGSGREDLSSVGGSVGGGVRVRTGTGKGKNE